MLYLHRVFQLMIVLLFTSQAIAESAGVTTDNAVIALMPPGQTTTAAFVTLHNTLEKPLVFKKAHADVAESVELHQSVIEQGVSKMRPLESLVIAPGASMTFESGASHIMLKGLKQPLKVGDVHKIEFCFDLVCLPVTFTVKNLHAAHHH